MLKLGIKSKLFAAISAVAATTVAAGVVGWLGFAKLDSAFQTITRDSLPAMSAALQLREASNALQNGLPSFLTIRNESDRKDALRNLENSNRTLRHSLNSINNEHSANHHSDDIAQARQLSEQIDAILRQASTTVQQRLSVTNLRMQRMQALRATHAEVLDSLRKAVAKTRQELIRNSGLMTVHSGRLLTHLMDQAIPNLQQTLLLKVQIDKAVALILAAAHATGRELSAIEETLTATLKQLKLVLQSLKTTWPDETFEYSGIELSILAIESFAYDDDGMFALRWAQLSEVESVGAKYRARLSALNERLLSYSRTLDELFDPLIALFMQSLGIKTDEFMALSQKMLPDIIEPITEKLHTLLSAIANINLLLGVLSEAAQASAAELPTLKTRYQLTEQTLHNAINTFNQARAMRRIAQKIPTLLEFGSGEDNIIALRQHELDAVARGADLVAKQAEVMTQLSALVKHQVADTQIMVDDTSDQVSTSINQAKQLLLGFIALGLVLSVLITWLFVGRNIVGRLLTMIQSIKRLAAGDLDVEIDIHGQDELAQMGAAVAILRENSLEKQRLQAQQQREREHYEKQQRAHWRLENERRAAQDLLHQQQLETAQREHEQAEELRHKVDQLLIVVDAIAAGDLTPTVPVTGNDPVGKMGNGLEQLLVQLRQSLGAIGHSSQVLTSAAEDLSLLSTNMGENAEQASAQSDKASSAASQISTNARSVANASGSITADIDRIAAQVMEAAEVADQAVSVAQSTDDHVRQLSISSADIGKVLNLIANIADQTNLLALNATIEASRAGEAGKGFAVVANEVKELAKETTRAADDIRQRIKTVQNDSQSAITAIGSIRETITQISAIQHTVAESIQQQAKATGTISQSVQDTAEGSADIAESIHNIAASTQDTQRSADKVQQSAGRLSEMAAEQWSLVAKFRLEAAPSQASVELF